MRHTRFIGLTSRITIYDWKSSQITVNPFRMRKTTLLAAILDFSQEILVAGKKWLQHWIPGPKISRNSMFSNLYLLWQKMVNFGSGPIFPWVIIRKKINFIPDVRVIAHFVGIFILINLRYAKMLQNDKKTPKIRKNCQKPAILAAILNFSRKKNIQWVGLVGIVILVDVCGKNRFSKGCKALSKGKNHPNQLFLAAILIFFSKVTHPSCNFCSFCNAGQHLWRRRLPCEYKTLSKVWNHPK